MQIVNMLGKLVTLVAGFAAISVANAADSSRNQGRGGTLSAASSGRMPTMPTTGLTVIGNPAVTTMPAPVQVAPKPNPNPKPDPKPKPDPEPDPEPDDSIPDTECPDGGIKDSKYTVNKCMSDLKQCINTGGLQGGMNDLYNEDVRNSVFTGMMLCPEVISKCIKEVRINCRNIYNDKNDVWLDFNSRVIQPDYYNFVLRKTGLTPFQAENTCLLLDRNTYGSAFTSVSDVDSVRAEYQKYVGAYNSADGGIYSKENPVGVKVNTTGYDGKRGHYARWDAVNAECLLRVAAYNKKSAIKNSWLFGAVGNDNPAEVWRPAGSSFTCNKDLFGFSLLNDTKTAAVVGIAGGAVVGTAVGAGIGAAVYDSKKKAADEAAKNASDDPCDNEQYRKELGNKIMESRNAYRLNSFLYSEVELKAGDSSEIEVRSAKPVFTTERYYEMNADQCKRIHNLFSKAKLYEDAIANCKANPGGMKVADIVTKQVGKLTAYEKVEIRNENGNMMVYSGSIRCGDANGLTETDVKVHNDECMFLPLQIGFSVTGPYNPFCNHDGRCKNVYQIEQELGNMQALLTEIEPAVDKTTLADAKKSKGPSKGAEIGKGAAIGAAAGIGVGGLATAITAFVERSNISCKVGDGLNSVSLGKTHKIDSLREFYVKWNLKLPDAISPTSVVVDRESWDQACSQFNSKLYDCQDVQINFKKDGKMDLIQSACKISGNLCIRNYSVASSHGIE